MRRHPFDTRSPFGFNSPFGQQGGAVTAPGALASRFDGSNDMIGLTAANAGIVDGPVVTVSMWFRFLTTGFRFFFKVNSLGTNFDLSIDASGVLLLRLEDTASSNIFSTFGGTNLDDGSWHHVAFSANTNVGQGARRFYIDGSVISNDSGFTGTDLDLASGTYAFPNATSVDVDLSEIWLGTQYIDLAASNPFISGGLPTDLGSDGSLPTGTAPEIYSAAADGTNAGTGADFTVTGAPESIAGPGA